MNILVTGALGFISSNLVPHLLNEGHTVIGFDNMSYPSIRPTERMKENSKARWEKFKFYAADVTSLKAMYSICVNEKIDHIVHLAATGSVPRSFESPENTLHNNVMGFVSICQLAKIISAKRLVFASSSSVYGDSSVEGKNCEGLEGRTKSPYAQSKKINEDFARIWLEPEKIPYVGLRFFNVYGPGQHPDSPYSAAIPKFITNQRPTVYGDGEQKRDFTYVDDVCEGIFKALTCEQHSFVCNLAKGQSTSINEVLKILGKEADHKPERHGEIKNSCADTGLCHRHLKYIPGISIEDGLKRTVAYYESLKP